MNYWERKKEAHKARARKIYKRYYDKNRELMAVKAKAKRCGIDWRLLYGDNTGGGPRSESATLGEIRQ